MYFTIIGINSQNQFARLENIINNYASTCILLNVATGLVTRTSFKLFPQQIHTELRM